MTKEEAKQKYWNIPDWNFVKPDQLPVGWGGHSCMDCANAVKIGEKCSKYKPSELTILDAFSNPCWVG